MRLKKLDDKLTVCKIEDISGIDFNNDILCLSKTKDEISLVCKTELIPDNVSEREDGFKAFKIDGKLDFSLIGILAPIAKILADNTIGIFVVSTFDTDYILVKEDKFERALDLLSGAGYQIL
ncbi:MAG: ACT domain-containing protein [Butyrivibrio sp.]|nr:ACT domain-containing protein [Butyrivibrio sp.]